MAVSYPYSGCYITIAHSTIIKLSVSETAYTTPNISSLSQMHSFTSAFGEQTGMQNKGHFVRHFSTNKLKKSCYLWNCNIGLKTFNCHIILLKWEIGLCWSLVCCSCCGGVYFCSSDVLLRRQLEEGRKIIY